MVEPIGIQTVSDMGESQGLEIRELGTAEIRLPAVGGIDRVFPGAAVLGGNGDEDAQGRVGDGGSRSRGRNGKCVKKKKNQGGETSRSYFPLAALGIFLAMYKSPTFSTVERMQWTSHPERRNASRKYPS